MNLMHTIDQNNPVLMAVFFLLCAMSLASWYVIFWKAFSLYRESTVIAAFRNRYAKTPDWPRHQIVGSKPPRLAGMIWREAERLEKTLAMSHVDDRRDILSVYLVQALDRAKVRLDSGLTLLASVGSASPFIGLFGTVWGIYGALMKVAAEGNAGLSVVAGPMGEALVATAAGLFAAIPAVIAYNSYVRSNRLLVQDLRHIAEQITLFFPVHTQPQNSTEAVRLVKEAR